MIAILGAGAFGASLACALGQPLRLWGRNLNPGARAAPRLPDSRLPDHVTICGSLAEAATGAQQILIAVPMRALEQTVRKLDARPEQSLIACCKGIDPATGLGPAATLRRHHEGPVGLLTGPSFADDIARGLPTALTLAMEDEDAARAAQAALSGAQLRLYTTTDVAGAELGGALKNVLAIAAGAVDGAGLGQSAQAALVTRGFGEIRQLAARQGAVQDTLLGLSGLGDLILTAFSENSRNYRFGQALGRGVDFVENTTVEGAATAQAVSVLAQKHGLDLPVLEATQRLIAAEISVADAVAALMARPLRTED